VNGRELTAEDVKFSYDRFLTEKGNPLKFMLDPVDRVEVVDRYTVRFRLKEPFVWLVNMLANPTGTWIVARELVDKYGDLKRPESAIGTGPFVLDRYEPNVKTIFRRNPDYFRPGQPLVDGVEWLVLEDDSVGLATYRTGQIDCGPWHGGSSASRTCPSQEERAPPGVPGLPVERDDGHLHADRQGSLQRRPRAPRGLARHRPPGGDRRRLSQGRAEPGISRGLPEWSPRIDQLGPGAKYYRYDPREARRLLAEAGFPQVLKTQMNVTGGYGSDAMDAFQVVQRHLKESGIDAELKVQEYGAYISSTFLGKYEGLAMGPFSIAWEPHTTLYGMYMPEQGRNSSHVSDPRIIAMLREQMRTRDIEARRRIIFDIHQYAAEQQYYVYLYSGRPHRILAPVGEELRAELQLRLRQQIGRPLARPLERG
jgi:peptide/nickel transport system substrate-binding protein